MTLETFFEQFELLADAPNGVQKLRELILQLAVQGKLVPQSSNDEFASVLLNKIHLKKTQLEKLGKIRKPITSLDSRDKPFNIPNSWEWSRINDVTLLVTDGEHATPTRISTPEVPLVTAKNVRNGHIDLGNTDFVSFETAQKCWKRCEPLHNDILMVCVGATTGRLSILKNPSKFVLVRSVALIRPANPHIYPEFLALAIKSPLGQSQVWGNVKQSAQPCLYINKIQNIYIPIPPTAEQKRIVDKVDRLMAMCDRLEEQQKKRRESCIRLNEGAIAQLLSASNAEESDRHWQRIYNNFDLFYSLPENIGKLRQAILQLAIQGKIVQQNSDEEPALNLLERLRLSTQLSNSKRGRNLENSLCLAIDNIPFEVPKSWQWSRFQDVATIASNLVKPQLYLDFPHIAPDNIEKQTGKLLPYRSVREDAVSSAKHHFFSGQLLYSKIRPNLAKVVLIDFDGLCSADMYPINVYICPKFLLNYMLSTTFLSMAVKRDTRVAMPKINQEELNKILVPVPPLAEQERIVAKVERLMKLCDELEAKLKGSYSHQEEILEVAAVQLMQATAKTPALC